MDRDGNLPGFFASAMAPVQGLNKIKPYQSHEDAFDIILMSAEFFQACAVSFAARK